MRKICCSSNTACTVSLSCRKDSGDVPNGFSYTTLDPAARPWTPIPSVRGPKAAGGTAR